MAAKPKLTPEEWVQARGKWESDPREGYTWLIDDLSLPLTRAALRKVAIRDGWAKKSTEDGVNPTVAKNATVEVKVSSKVAKASNKAAGKPTARRANKGGGDKVSGFKVSKVSEEAMVSKVSEVMETIDDDRESGEESSRNRGRPTLYREDYAKQAYRLCLLGATDNDLAEAFDVDQSTITHWKRDHPDFFTSLSKGKIEADSRVAESTYKLAIGDVFVQEEKLTRLGGVVTLVKQIPPDHGAQKTWLFNRQPKLWKNKIELKEEINLNVFPPKEELDAIYQKALADAAQRNEMLIGRRERLGLVIDSESGDVVG